MIQRREATVRLARPDERGRWDEQVDRHHYLGFKRFAGRGVLAAREVSAVGGPLAVRRRPLLGQGRDGGQGGQRGHGHNPRNQVSLKSHATTPRASVFRVHEIHDTRRRGCDATLPAGGPRCYVARRRGAVLRCPPAGLRCQVAAVGPRCRVGRWRGRDLRGARRRVAVPGCRRRAALPGWPLAGSRSSRSPPAGCGARLPPSGRVAGLAAGGVAIFEEPAGGLRYQVAAVGPRCRVGRWRCRDLRGARRRVRLGSRTPSR